MESRTSLSRAQGTLYQPNEHGENVGFLGSDVRDRLPADKYNTRTATHTAEVLGCTRSPFRAWPPSPASGLRPAIRPQQSPRLLCPAPFSPCLCSSRCLPSAALATHNTRCSARHVVAHGWPIPATARRQRGRRSLSHSQGLDNRPRPRHPHASITGAVRGRSQRCLRDQCARHSVPEPLSSRVLQPGQGCAEGLQ